MQNFLNSSRARNISTVILFVFFGLMQPLLAHSQLAKQISPLEAQEATYDLLVTSESQQSRAARSYDKFRNHETYSKTEFFQSTGADERGDYLVTGNLQAFHDSRHGEINQASPKPYESETSLVSIDSLTNRISSRDGITYSIAGQIFDAQSGEPLYAATVQIENTYTGTITNASGEFMIRTRTMPVTVVVRFIGYESQRITIETPSAEPIIVQLVPTPVSMGEIVVTGEDPAIRIMREVIARKPIWRDMLDSYIAEAYTRQRLENDTGIVSITESVSRAYWDKRRGSREVLVHRQQTSNMDISQNFAGATLLPNFYDDNISISGFDLVGVTHPDALRYYHFKLEGFRELDGRTVYDIAVTPRRRLQPTFEGRIAVLSEVYALLEVDLRPGDSVMFPPPIQEFGLWYRQQFSNFGQDFWLPVDIRIEGTIKFGFPGLQFPTVNFHQMSRLSNYEVNVPVPDTLFSISRRLIPETFLTGEDMPDPALVHLERHIPLDDREAQAYSTLDSTQTLEKSFEPTGALARFVTNDERESREPGVFGRAVRGFTPEIGYNRVDAGRFGLSYSPSTKGSLTPSVFAVYLSGTNDVDYGASLKYQARSGDRRSRPLRVEAGYGYQTTRIFEASQVHPLMASTGMLLGTYDYFDYYKVERGYINASKRLNNHPVRWNLGLNQSRFNSLTKVTNYSIPGGIIQRENPGIDEGIGRYVEVGLEFGGSPAPFGVTGGRNAEVSVLHSGGHLGSDFDFTRFSARVDYRFETFFKRRFMPNTLDIRLTGGAALGNLPLQHMHSIDTSIRYFTPFGGLRAAQGVPIRSDRQLSLSWEHNFRTIPFEIIGFDAPVRKGIGFIVHGAHAYQHQVAPLSTGDSYHHEIGLSLNGLFSVLRIDATARIDRPGFYLGASVARIF